MGGGGGRAGYVNGRARRTFTPIVMVVQMHATNMNLAVSPLWSHGGKGGGGGGVGGGAGRGEEMLQGGTALRHE